ncbi:MAG: hypothetical protein V7K67_03170 [Nostoc sp.]
MLLHKDLNILLQMLYKVSSIVFGDWGLGTGDWGLGTGDWEINI